jgi:hypothetical protein
MPTHVFVNLRTDCRVKDLPGRIISRITFSGHDVVVIEDARVARGQVSPPPLQVRCPRPRTDLPCRRGHLDLRLSNRSDRCNLRPPP